MPQIKCPKCTKLIGREESHCPKCGANIPSTMLDRSPEVPLLNPEHTMATVRDGVSETSESIDRDLRQSLHQKFDTKLGGVSRGLRNRLPE